MDDDETYHVVSYGFFRRYPDQKKQLTLTDTKKEIIAFLFG